MLTAELERTRLAIEQRLATGTAPAEELGDKLTII